MLKLLRMAAPLYQQVKQALLADIAAGRYSPGRPFITQREICERFDVSHATAVRALNDLAAEGHLVRRRGQGTFVADGIRHAGRPARSPASCSTTARTCRSCSPGSRRRARSSATGCSCGTARATPNARSRRCGRRSTRASTGSSSTRPRVATSTGAYAEVRQRGVPLVMVDRYRPDLATDAVVADNFARGQSG